MKGQKLEIRNNGNTNATIRYQLFSDLTWKNGVVLKPNQVMKIWCVKGTFSSVSKNVVILSSLDWPSPNKSTVKTLKCVLPNGLTPITVLTSVILENPSEVITFDLTPETIYNWLYSKSNSNYDNRNEIRTYTSIYSYNPERMVLYNRTNGCKAVDGHYITNEFIQVVNGNMLASPIDFNSIITPTPTVTPTVTPTPLSFPQIDSISFPVANFTMLYINIYIDNDGGSPITQCGVVYNTTGNPTTADNVILYSNILGLQGQNFTRPIPGQPYYFAAFATNSVGTSYLNYGVSGGPI